VKRTALIRRTPLARGGWLRRRPRPKHPGVGPETFAAIWREDLGPCVVCPLEGGFCIGEVQGHHILSKQLLRRRGLFFEMLDHRNRLPVCEYRHEQHTTGYKPIPRAALPESVFEFAKELDLEWYLDKHYPILEATAA
jgi:hypothetical protein